MLQLAEQQRKFASALLDAAQVVPFGLVGPDGKSSLKRFSVYRNNVVVGLVDALAAAYPATQRIVGGEFFRAMARAYAVTHPPKSPIMLCYGDTFAGFVATFEPARPLPYLADVAGIERAWLEAYHACEATSLSAAAFAAIPKDQVANIRLVAHPSVRIVRSRFPALTIWRMNVRDGVPEPMDIDADGEDALIMRPEADVEVRAMPPGGAEFVGALMRGRSLSEAAEIAMRIPNFDLAANLATLIDAGAFTGYEVLRFRRVGKGEEAVV